MTDFDQAAVRADETQKRVRELLRLQNELRENLRQAEEDNTLAQAALVLWMDRQRRQSVLPLSDGYRPGIYHPEEN